MSTKKDTSKKPTNVDTSHYFIDGHSSRKGLLAAIGFPNRLRGKDFEFTTLYFTLNDDWSHETFEFDGRSITYQGSTESGNWWLLGKRGEVAQIGDQIQIDHIPGAGTGPKNYGCLNRIALIGNRLYTCGFRRQVYVRDSGSWKHMDHGLLEPRTNRGSSLEAIDGCSEECIYAVGSGGQIWLFNGNDWHQCASPTNADLHEVKVVSPTEVLIVGQRGTALIGNRDSWDVLDRGDFDEDLWGVEKFLGQIYVAGYSGIGQALPTGLVPVDTGLGRIILGYRLRSREGLLWSIGNDEILVFDGTNWREVVCPDNGP